MRSVAGAIRSLINAMSLHLECSRVMHEPLLLPILTYGSETMIWRGKERPRIRAVQIYNLRGLLDIRRMDKILNTRIKELCGVARGGRQKG